MDYRDGKGDVAGRYRNKRYHQSDDEGHRDRKEPKHTHGNGPNASCHEGNSEYYRGSQGSAQFQVKQETLEKESHQNGNGLPGHGGDDKAYNAFAQLVADRKVDVELLETQIAELHKQLEEKRSKLAEAQGLLQGMSRPEQTNGSNLPPPPPGQPASGKPRLAIPSGELLGRNKPAPGHSEERRAGTERAPVGQREGFASESTRGHDAAPGPSSQQQQQLQQHDRLRQPGGATTSGRGGPGANEGTRDGSRREQAREKQQPRGSACRPDDGNSPEPSRVPAAAKRVPLPATVNIIPLIRSSKDAHGGGGGSMMLRHSEYVGSQHKRKLRSLVLSPSNPNQCATSALDGVINFWEIQNRGKSLMLRFSADCLSPGNRRWPEDLAWHPDGSSLVAVFTADNDDSQVAIIKNGSKKKTIFLADKPHDKGIINSVAFMPWEQPASSSTWQFVSGGSDHCVVLWTDDGSGTNPPQAKVLHKRLHTSAVMGVAGMRGKPLVVSGGADKRLVTYDAVHRKEASMHMLDNKLTAVLPNTADHNLLLVQTGTPGQQIRLFDVRIQRTQLHSFGWQQQSSESQSALISPSWSPDGLYVATGSADPKIHIFDIRYNSKDPAATADAHSKRVFKAAWHQSMPVVISISSDLTIGLHSSK